LWIHCNSQNIKIDPNSQKDYYYIEGLILKLKIYIFAAVFSVFAGQAFAAAKALLIADMDSGEVLYQEHGADENYPASLTKIMTLYLTFDALEAGRLTSDQNLIVSKRAANQPPTKLGLKPGDKITVETAIKALIIRSANDVATVLSENLKGDESDFSETMTRVANEIGLKQTLFHNASGLPNEDHISSARDIALLSIAVYQHFPQYFHYFNSRSFKYNGQTYYTHNQILNTYAGANGMKTGYTNKARYNLAASAKRDGVQLLAITLGAANSKERLNITTRLLDYGFALKNNESVSKFNEFNTSYNAKFSEDVDESITAYENPERVGAVSTEPVKSEPKKAAAKSYSSGNSGVQFGAFGSEAVANKQAKTVKSVYGLSAKIEPYNGLYRVRVYGLSESAASKIKGSCAANNIQCFIFH
jgi:D-alanyl-D-alanine carboxypeptidase (penicillin-binding protein 5/6)